MIKDFISIIKKPIEALEKKFGNNVKKGFIFLGIIVGILFLTTFIHQLYRTMIGMDGKLHFDYLKNFGYFKFILNFFLDQIFYFGSIAAGIFVFAAISKKDFKLIDIVSIAVIAYVFNYLVQSCFQILFMFDFIQVKFLLTVRSIILSLAAVYSLLLIVIGLQKAYDIKLNDKSFISLVVMFGTQIAIYTLLSLTI